ncbi:hypothetical protein [Leptospira borgpetersenii]|uniref:hypothetical protein n=1 Tax=Leptospira borgpetersenii TaxID=174 RepID=UPI00188B9E1B|nr:hypothetical protein [Leptospira borgpetersenii]MBF3378388.1 hypothetical protein [Leptospira borgpetersenii serovar Balcanica]
MDFKFKEGFFGKNENATNPLRQNGAPSGLEKRGLDASIYHKTKKPTEGTQ